MASNDHQVLVLTMSTLAPSVKSESSYYLENQKPSCDEPVVKGYSQMEVIPLFLKNKMMEDITDVIVLATPQTDEDDVVFRPKTAEETCDELVNFFKDEKLDQTDIKPTMTAVDFFTRRMNSENVGLKGVNIEVIRMDVFDPASGLEKAQMRIRDLYASCENKKKWKLWVDVHGGFRDVSMTLFGLMQMLTAPDEQELVGYVTDEEQRRILAKRMNDGKERVPLTAVYTVEYNPIKKEGVILDRTVFLRTFTLPAIVAYMNYGQYANTILRSTELNGKPYAFISYKTGEATDERFAFLGRLKELGYRYWYDDALIMQREWEPQLVKANAGANVFIALITQGYFKSVPCINELRQAIEEQKEGKKKVIILALLDGTRLDAARDESGNITVVDEKTGKPVKGDDGQPVQISKADVDGILAKHQFELGKVMRDGTIEGVHYEAFQDTEFERRFEELVGSNQVFASIKG